MCTGLSYFNGTHHFFGRNLDLEIDYPVDVVITPENHVFNFRHAGTLEHHNAFIGMGMVEADYPLMFEAVNNKGLGIAGLAFWNSAYYFEPQEGKTNVASFELIPYLLGTCDSVEDLEKVLPNLNITNDSFAPQMPASPLHWIMADRKKTIVVESTKTGLHVYDNPFNVLTNEPEFPFHESNLSWYCNIGSDFTGTRFAPNMPDFTKFGAGMGTAGLPGGVDPVSRFVRVAFTNLNSVADKTLDASIQQYFNILGSVRQVSGSDQVKPGVYEVTQYTSGCDTDTGIFYYTTYYNQSLNAVDMNKEDLSGDKLIAIPLHRELQVNMQN